VRESEFWRFSLAFYARPGMADACLELQDKATVDVNVMFYLLFLASRGRQTDDIDVARIAGIAQAWRDTVVVPLRAVRRALKSPIGPYVPALTSALRSDVKRTELAAERIQQETMERSAPPDSFRPATTDRASTARANVAAYCRLLGEFPAGPLELVLSGFAQHSSAGDRP
jgi:uncharacterized protein (TIGR02444 family)